jgi:hypothetical protein
MSSNLTSNNDWPSLPFAEWEATCDTVHMWTQIVGKTRMTLSAPQNHWWHVPFYVTPRGLSTSAIPFGKRSFDVEFDFVAHQVAIRTSAGDGRSIPLYPRSVADFYAEYMACLRSLGIEVAINPAPEEFDDPTPLDQDRHHASYDTEYVERFRRILVQVDQVLKQFRSRYIGKCSPVHFFWGSFDLACTRFSGRPAPRHAGGAPNCPDWVMVEAYSQEVSSCGFWAGGGEEGAFYAYAYPEPQGFAASPVRPDAAGYSDTFQQFLLPYEAVRRAEEPDQMVLEFLQTTYAAAADLGGWDRARLEDDPYRVPPQPGRS